MPEQDPPVLLAPASLGRSLALSQLVTGEYGDQSYSMRFEVEVTPDRLVMVGLSHLGVPLFTLRQEGEIFSVEAPDKDQVPFDPRYILADFQLVHWPATELSRALAARGLELSDGPDRATRRVFGAGGRLLVEIERVGSTGASDEVVIRHFDHPYRLRIKTLEARDKP